MAADKVKLKNVLCKYSTIQELLAPEDRLLLEEDILAGNFPLSALTGTYMKRSAALSAVVISFHYHNMCNRLSEWKNEVGDGGS